MRNLKTLVLTNRKTKSFIDKLLDKNKAQQESSYQNVNVISNENNYVQQTPPSPPITQDTVMRTLPSTLFTEDTEEITALNIITKDSGAIVDSGASFIAVPSNYPLKQETSNFVNFTDASGNNMVSTSKGFIDIMGHELPAMRVQGLSTPLISVKVLTERGFDVYFTKDAVYALDNSEDVPFHARKFWKLGEIKPDNTYRLCSSIVLEDNFKLYALKEARGEDLPTDFDSWTDYQKAIFITHISTGHKSPTLMVKERLIHSKDVGLIKSCIHCKIAKFKNPPKIKKTHISHAKKPHVRIHADVYYTEKLFQTSYNHEKFYVTVIVDDFSNYLHTEIHPSKSMSEVSKAINNYIHTYNNFYDRKLNEIKCDKGPEFNGINLDLIQKDVILAPTNDKERNGTAERFVNLHKTMLKVITGHLHIALKAMFYSYAVHHATVLLNFSTKANSKENPYNLQHGQKKELPSSLPVFLEDVIAEISLAGKQLKVLGTFLQFDPNTNMCQIMIQTPYNEKTVSFIEISYYKLVRTYKIYNAKLFITDTRWDANQKIWGKKPANWETSFIDVITNQAGNIDQPQGYFNNHGIQQPVFNDRDSYDDAMENDLKQGKGYKPVPVNPFDSNATLAPLRITPNLLATNGHIFKLSEGFAEDINTDVEPDIDKKEASDTMQLNTFTAAKDDEDEELTFNKLCSVVQSVSYLDPDTKFQVRKDDTTDTGEIEIIQQDSHVGMIVPKPPKKLDLDITGEWREPVMKEKQKYIDMDVLKPANFVPKGGTLLRPLWVYVAKPDRLKARMVCFNPKTVHKTQLMKSAPVISAPAINLLFGIAARQNQQVQFFDIDNAFLYADMPAQKYYMVTPPIFKDVYKTKYVELNKSTYGLQESPRAFYDHLSKILITKLGFTQHKMEPCLFYKGHSMLIAFHVDDGAIAGSPEDIEQFLRDIEQYFSFKRTNGSYLGIDVTYHASEDTTTKPLPIWDKVIDPTEDLSTISPTFDSGYHPWTVLQQSEVHCPSNIFSKTSGYGSFKTLPQAAETHIKDITVAFEVPDPPPPGDVKFEFSMTTHINKFLTKFKDDNPDKIAFLKTKPVQYDALLKEFACPINGSPIDFIESIDEYHGIPAQWHNIFKQNVSNQSLVGSLSYFIHKCVPSMTFAISVLSRYNRYPHRTVSYLLHCLVRDLFHMDLSLLFRQSRTDSDFFDVHCFSDAAYSSATGTYHKGTVITLDGSPILFKSSIGRNKHTKGSTTQVELEAAHDSFAYLLRVINLLITMKYKVSTFLYVDNLPLLRSLHNNHMAPSTTGTPKLQVLRNAILKEVIKAGYVPGTENPADVYTKSFTTSKLKEYFKLKGNEYLQYEYNNQPKLI